MQIGHFRRIGIRAVKLGIRRLLRGERNTQFRGDFNAFVRGHILVLMRRILTLGAHAIAFDRLHQNHCGLTSRGTGLGKGGIDFLLILPSTFDGSYLIVS